MIEIERKFLVISDAFKKEASSKYTIKQGYLSSVPERTVRIRTMDAKGFLTIKGKSSDSGVSRFEWEKEINYNEALQLLGLCENGCIEKIRYEVPKGRFLFEIDVFAGQNEGLIVAEVELKSENDFFEKPFWLGEEVTGDSRYYNSYLSNTPFKNWSVI